MIWPKNKFSLNLNLLGFKRSVSTIKERTFSKIIVNLVYQQPSTLLKSKMVDLYFYTWLIYEKYSTKKILKSIVSFNRCPNLRVESAILCFIKLDRFQIKYQRLVNFTYQLWYLWCFGVFLMYLSFLTLVCGHL